jgi:hypothetical protein
MTRSPRRDFFIILILGALSTVSPFSIDMYLPAFPQIAHDLGTTPWRSGSCSTGRCSIASAARSRSMRA